MKKLIIIIFTSFLILSGCSSNKIVTPETEGEQIEILYSKGLELAKKKDYADAAMLFEDIERQYPYSSWSSQAQLMASFCWLRSSLYEESLNAIDRYLALNPGSKNVDYAYYLIGLNHYNQISDVQRDQSAALTALKSFNKIREKFPNSKYKNDSAKKIILINNRLAGKEMHVGRTYQNDHQWIAAINRFNYVINNFDKTKYTPEALHRLVEIYLAIGVHDEAKKYAATLGHNYPGSYWYNASYKLINEIILIN